LYKLFTTFGCARVHKQGTQRRGEGWDGMGYVLGRQGKVRENREKYT